MPRKKAEPKTKEKKQEPETRRIEIKPRSEKQAKYLRAIQSCDITFCTGLPGTGKTFLAVAEAVRQLQHNQIEKIIIARPIVESGESLGYLPGSLEQKSEPYLVPIFDSLKVFLSYSDIAQLKNANKLEISPLAYMRGRTFLNAFIILDEAQNATLKQLKMLLTRIGSGSKMVICGDTKQSDLRHSDLDACIACLTGVDGIATIALGAEDIVRHPLIGVIIQRLEEVEVDLEIIKSRNRMPLLSRNGNGKH